MATAEEDRPGEAGVEVLGMAPRAEAAAEQGAGEGARAAWGAAGGAAAGAQRAEEEAASSMWADATTAILAAEVGAILAADPLLLPEGSADEAPGAGEPPVVLPRAAVAGEQDGAAGNDFLEMEWE